MCKISDWVETFPDPHQGQIFHVSLLFTKTRQLISEEIFIDKLLTNFSINLQLDLISLARELSNLCGGKSVPLIYIIKSGQAETCVDIDN